MNSNGILFIINPISGRGKALETEKLINRICRKRNKAFSIQKTYSPGDGSMLAKKGLAAGFEAIIAVGGDGTVNEVGREMVGSEIPLGIVPAGSGNGLARHMKIPMNSRRAIKRILRDRKKQIDTGLLNGMVFLNVAGIGFDARVSKEFSKSKERGLINYIKIILKQFSNIQNLKVSLNLNGNTEEKKVVMISFANSAQFGNNAKIAPKASTEDGKIDVCILYPTGILNSFAFVIRLLTGNLKKTTYFDTFQVEKYKLSGSGRLAHIDGDAVKVSDEIVVEVKPKSLYILV